MSEREEITEFRKAIQTLEAALNVLFGCIGRPLAIEEEKKGRFRYADSSPIVFQTLKAIRVVSGLNALLCLLERGFTQEMGVLLRTVDDFLAEIDFVSEAIRTGKPTADQKRILEGFFSEDVRTTEELLASREARSRVPRRKIQASEGRQLGGQNPHKIIVMTSAVDDVLSGYVHGGYPQIMELYEGGAERFHTRGVLGSPHIESFRKQVGIYIHRSLNILASLLLQLGRREECDLLIGVRKNLEKAVPYLA